MVTSQDRAGQVVEACVTVFTAIALPVRLGLISTMTGHGSAIAGRTPNAIWPAVLPNEIKTLRIINQR
jgi:hypothetical protein